MPTLTFSWIDYLCFCSIFFISTIVGIYYGCFGNKQSTTKDYLYGGKNMKVLPVAMSMVAGSLTGFSLLSIPSEIYIYGTQYWITILGAALMGVVNNFVYLPVFYELQLSSTYEYLALRFDKTVSKLAFFLFAISSCLLLPIIIYAPALALNQVTGLNINIIIPTTAAICTFYTAIGGLKTIIWTDTLQLVATIAILGFVLVKGTILVGGLPAIWERAYDGDRIEFFNLNPDPTVRATFWSVLLGQTFLWISYVGVHPAGVQRFLATPTLRDAKLTSLTFIAVGTITKSLTCFFGLIMYAKYFDCDPFTTGKISKPDQMLPYFVMEVGGSGLSGLFIAAIFTTALSTLSTYLNSLSGALYTDLIAPFMPEDTSEQKASYIMKVITLIAGTISLLIALFIGRLGSILEIHLGLNGIIAGPLIGMFTLGMVFPFTSSKGALYGGVASLLFVAWIAIKAKLHAVAGNIKYEPKPLFTYGCNETLQTYNATASPPLPSFEEPFWLFTVSFHYYMVIGGVVTIVIGVLHGWLTNKSKDKVRRELLSPFVHIFLSKCNKTNYYQSVKEKQELEVCSTLC